MQIFRALMIWGVLAVPMAAGAETAAQTAAPGVITVTGEGVVEGAPDLAVLTLGVTTQAATAAAALAANSEGLAAVLARLSASGIEARDMQTSNLSLNPNWTGYDQGAPKLVDYTATNQVTVRVRDLASLGVVLDAAVTDGANTLNGLMFGLSDPRPAMDTARKAAVTDARARAELLAGAAGVTLGRVLSISEGGAMTQPGPMFKSMGAADAMAVPVASGEVATSASVTVVFEIVQ